MTDDILSWDVEAARQDGEAFGRLAARQASAAMTRANLTEAEAKALGADAVGTVLARANALADTGLSRDLVEAWTDAAAEAFNLELKRAAALLATPGTQH